MHTVLRLSDLHLHSGRLARFLSLRSEISLHVVGTIQLSQGCVLGSNGKFARHVLSMKSLHS